ncbi:hypothetical protein N8I84_42135 (plasmid) [Streptomyces cynarae]|uniref:Uncharacterized protein n=1 Tax=Streptomyces cynarae TaxID=2981134 RepID=A0ABY6EEF0_9ACTN|nr:hypothetical protein [Streptomyces cynarae]UXY25029.1 hypothetical protein N8I84_42135 [Streptomyces cynarae]
MRRPTRKSAAPTKPLLKPPLRIGKLDTAALIGDLRHLHEKAEDVDIDRMPADEELFGALLYLEAHAGALKSKEAQRTSAITRVKLWEYLRERVDVHQAKAIAHARAANVEWADLAPALAVNTASAAYNKATRLRAAALTNPDDGDRPVRRTPEAVLEAERKAAARVAAERRAQEEAARRHQLLVPVLQRLIDHRNGLDDNEDVAFWLDQIAETLPDCHTPTQIVSLGIYAEAVIRELRKIERTTARPVATTDGARSAYAAAAQMVSGRGRDT